MSLAKIGNKNAVGMIPWNKGKGMSEEYKIKSGLANKGKHRSPRTEFKKGQIPWNKKCGDNGLTEIMKMRTSVEYRAWRLSVYRRDWFTCQMPECGYKGRDIESHHIKKVKDCPDLIFDVNNGITLCQKCHLPTRNKEGQYEELFSNIVQPQSSKETL